MGTHQGRASHNFTLSDSGFSNGGCRTFIPRRNYYRNTIVDPCGYSYLHIPMMGCCCPAGANCIQNYTADAYNRVLNNPCLNLGDFNYPGINGVGIHRPLTVNTDCTPVDSKTSQGCVNEGTQADSCPPTPSALPSPCLDTTTTGQQLTYLSFNPVTNTLRGHEPYNPFSPKNMNSDSYSPPNEGNPLYSPFNTNSVLNDGFNNFPLPPTHSSTLRKTVNDYEEPRVPAFDYNPFSTTEGRVEGNPFENNLNGQEPTGESFPDPRQNETKKPPPYLPPVFAPINAKSGTVYAPNGGRGLEVAPKVESPDVQQQPRLPQLQPPVHQPVVQKKPEDAAPVPKPKQASNHGEGPLKSPNTSEENGRPNPVLEISAPSPAPTPTESQREKGSNKGIVVPPLKLKSPKSTPNASPKTSLLFNGRNSFPQVHSKVEVGPQPSLKQGASPPLSGTKIQPPVQRGTSPIKQPVNKSTSDNLGSDVVESPVKNPVVIPKISKNTSPIISSQAIPGGEKKTPSRSNAGIQVEPDKAEEGTVVEDPTIHNLDDTELIPMDEQPTEILPPSPGKEETGTETDGVSVKPDLADEETILIPGDLTQEIPDGKKGDSDPVLFSTPKGSIGSILSFKKLVGNISPINVMHVHVPASALPSRKPSSMLNFDLLVPKEDPDKTFDETGKESPIKLVAKLGDPKQLNEDESIRRESNSEHVTHKPGPGTKSPTTDKQVSNMGDPRQLVGDDQISSRESGSERVPGDTSDGDKGREEVPKQLADDKKNGKKVGRGIVIGGGPNVDDDVGGGNNDNNNGTNPSNRQLQLHFPPWLWYMGALILGYLIGKNIGVCMPFWSWQRSTASESPVTVLKDPILPSEPHTQSCLSRPLNFTMS